MESKSITLERSLQAATDLIQGDDYELQQAFVNLVLNALEAMGSDGRLTVTTETVGTNGAPQIRITFNYTGVGIPPENMARLFEPFFTTKPSGTGLGLAITQRLIQEHQGTISVQSTPSQGTTFEIHLPAAGGNGGVKA